MAQSTITIGGIMAGLIQFIIIMTLIEPVVAISTTPAFASSYYGVVNNTQYNVTNNLQNPLATQANSSASQISPGVLQSFGGLAFIPAAFGSFYKSLTNFPNMLFKIMTTSFNYLLLPYIGVAIVGILSISIFVYVGILMVFKFFGFISKTDIENL